MYKDGNGFPLTLKPSHLTNPVERMDTAEILSVIVEQACLYDPEMPVGVQNMKRSKALTKVKAPNEALTEVKVSNGPLTSVEKAPMVASDLVRLK